MSELTPAEVPIELTPRERRQQRTQHSIIDAARQIIREKGVEALSMRAIADRIDYSPAGLYEYFASKEEIIGAVCEQNAERFTEWLAAVDTTLPPLDYMLALGLAYIDFAASNPDAFLLMFTTIPLSQTNQEHPDIYDIDAVIARGDAFGILVKGVHRCVEAGLYPTRPDFGVLEMAYASWTQVHGLAMLRVTNGDLFPFDYATVERNSLRAQGAGLAHPQ